MDLNKQENMGEKQYFNPQKGSELDKGYTCNSCEKIKCYFNGLWYVCPNPKDKSRSESLQKQYENGVYINQKNYYISQEDFSNSDNWNS